MTFIELADQTAGPLFQILLDIFFLRRTLSPSLNMENVVQPRYNGPNSFLQRFQCNYFLPLTKQSGTSVDEMRKPELDCFPKASTVVPSWHSFHAPKESRLQGNGNLRTHHGDSQLNIVTFSLTICEEAAAVRKCCVIFNTFCGMKRSRSSGFNIIQATFIFS